MARIAANGSVDRSALWLTLPEASTGLIANSSAVAIQIAEKRGARNQAGRSVTADRWGPASFGAADKAVSTENYRAGTPPSATSATMSRRYIQDRPGGLKKCARTGG
jgi:hypothetical protein